MSHFNGHNGEPEEELAHFEKPNVQYNEHGWGPGPELPENFQDIPYQPFSKSDRLGKISDWTTSKTDKKHPNKYTSSFGTGNQYAYYHEEDETTFHLVDTARVQKPPYQRGRFRNTNQRGSKLLRGRVGRGGGIVGSASASGSGGGAGGGGGGLNVNQTSLAAKNLRRRGGKGRKFSQRGQPKMRVSSVAVRPEWIVLEEMDFPRLMKLQLPNIGLGEDLVTCGALEYYDKMYDRINLKSERTLQKVDRVVHTVTTTDDPIIRRLSKTVGNVFATDLILATIMCATRSNYSWDIVVEKFGDKIFFDKRDNTEFDLLTVNETSFEPPNEDDSSPNSPRNLAIEATFVNHNFSQQVLKTVDRDAVPAKGSLFTFEEGNPFVCEEDNVQVSSIGYRYKKWELGGGIVLVARCEHDAVWQTPNGELQFLSIKALNEWNPKLTKGIDWRQKLDTQRGAVLANEMRNNACKLAKWTVQALLAGSDQMKLGFVSRIQPRDPSRHVILGTQQFRPHEFALQINLSMDNAWGILRCIIDIVMKQKDGKYLILKDPNKPILRLYDIPDNSFEDSDDETTSSSAESEDEGDGDDEAEESFVSATAGTSAATTVNPDESQAEPEAGEKN